MNDLDVKEMKKYLIKYKDGIRFKCTHEDEHNYYCYFHPNNDNDDNSFMYCLEKSSVSDETMVKMENLLGEENED